jgi:hypothetical protein
MDDPTEPATSFTATLTGAQEVPAVTTTASGSATCSGDGTGFSCTVTYAGLSGAPTSAHIHVGNAGTAATGNIRINLCGAGTAPACPTTASGTITSGAQLPTSGTYAALLTSMQGFGAYVNVHTATNAGGEIRGQIFGVY